MIDEKNEKDLWDEQLKENEGILRILGSMLDIIKNQEERITELEQPK